MVLEVLANDKAIHDRRQELKAFDDLKDRIKGLVDAGVEKIPQIFIQPLDPLDENSSTWDNEHFMIPIIDLGSIKTGVDQHKEIINQVRRASETWGFFQVVNHGIAIDVLDGIIGVRRFNEEHKEVKMKYYTRDYKRRVVFNSNFDLYQAPAANWRDTLFCVMGPNPLDPKSCQVACRDIITEYSKQIKKMGMTLFELLSEALELSPDHLKDMGCAEGHSILCHYYPACPQPQLTMGTPSSSSKSMDRRSSHAWSFSSKHWRSSTNKAFL